MDLENQINSLSRFCESQGMEEKEIVEFITIHFFYQTSKEENRHFLYIKDRIINLKNKLPILKKFSAYQEQEQNLKEIGEPGIKNLEQSIFLFASNQEYLFEKFNEYLIKIRPKVLEMNCN